MATDRRPSPSPRPVAGRRLATWAEVAAVLVLQPVVLFACHPRLWWTIRSRIWARVSDIYRPGDLGGTLFLMARALRGEEGPRSTLLARPHGFPFDGDFANTAVTDFMAVFQDLWGLPLGYNLAVTVLLATNGLAVHLAARLAGARGGPALVAGLVATSAPLLLEEVLIGRPVTCAWAPAILATTLCLAALDGHRKRWLALPGLAALALAVRIYPYGPVLLLPWTVFAGLLALGGGARDRGLRALVLVVAAAAVAWVAGATALEAGGGYLDRLPASTHVSLSLGELVDARRGTTHLRRIPLLLWIWVGAGALVGRRSAGRWAPAALGTGLLLALSLGGSPFESAPHARQESWMPFPWAMDHLPILRGCPRPTRYAMPGVLLLALWGALAWSGPIPGKGADGRDRPWFRRIAILLLGIGILAQVRAEDPAGRYPRWPPLPPVPSVQDDPVTLDLPLAFRGDKAPMLLFAWLPVPRFNPPGHRFTAWRRRVDPQALPLLAALLALESGGTPKKKALGGLASSLPEVEEHGLRHVLVHPGQSDPSVLAAQEALLTSLGAEPLRDPPPESHALRVYRLPGDPGVPSP